MQSGQFVKRRTSAELRWVRRETAPTGRNLPVPPPTIIFTHVPKTGGTTLDYISHSVANLNEDAWHRLSGTVYGQDFGKAKAEARSHVGAKTNILRKARYITGHAPIGLHRELGTSPCYVTLLRDPVARVASQLRHVLRATHAEDTEAWFERMVKTRAIVDNVQVRMIAGCTDAAVPCDEHMLAAAKQNLQSQVSYFGFTDEFEQFLQTLIALFDWPSLLFSKRNVRPGKPMAMTPHRERLIGDLTHYDTALFAYARDMHAAKTAEALAKAPLARGRDCAGQVLVCGHDLVKAVGAPLLSEESLVSSAEAFGERGLQVVEYPRAE